MGLGIRSKAIRIRRSAGRRLRDQLFARGRSAYARREDVARVYLKGSGIEIGALNAPLRVPPWARVRYVDYLPLDRLREHHLHLLWQGQQLVAPDVVDNGERLESFDEGSLDFVIANHFIEHTEDPIGTLANHLRVLRPGGMLYMAVPDKRRTFDVDRSVTPLDHLIRDHAEGPDWSRDEHYREWARFVDHIPDDDVDRHADELAGRRFSIHFHVWTPSTYMAMLLHCQEQGMPFEVELIQRNGLEFITVLRKLKSDQAEKSTDDMPYQGLLRRLQSRLTPATPSQRNPA